MTLQTQLSFMQMLVHPVLPVCPRSSASGAE